MLSLTDIAASLKDRWRLQLVVFAVVMALVLVWTALSAKVYIATSSLLFDDIAVDPVGTQAGVDGLKALLSTQSDVVKSEAVAANVVKSLQLVTPQVAERWRKATGGNGDVNSWYGRQLLSNLDVSPVTDSRVLELSYSAPDPQFAALIANGFAVSYLDTRLKFRTDPAKTYSRWFQDRTREVRTDLEQAQARLTAFKRQTGIVDSGVAVDPESARLAELSGQLTGAEASAAELAARAGRSVSQSPDVQGSAVVQGLRSQIASKSAQVSQMAATLGPNHPDRVAAEAELGELRARLNAEIGTATRSVQVASGAASTKQAALRGMLNAQRGRMLGLSTDRAQLDVLQHDVDSSRAAYDAVTAKLETMRLQAVAPESNARQLDQATPPLLPAQPNVPLRLLLGAVLAAMLAVAVGILMELRRPLLRTASGVANIGGVPVLAAVDFDRSRIGQMYLGVAQ
uniref:exopolysaccharide biosynthesis protein n=1 Tax=uncultured Sphingomonas sp. TaxID=158754 RepID=UPI0035CAE41C